MKNSFCFPVISCIYAFLFFSVVVVTIVAMCSAVLKFSPTKEALYLHLHQWDLVYWSCFALLFFRQFSLPGQLN